ncbi:MAG TPA: hypothetical protein VF652_02080 [Allosphingosinicella sp.]|jgi:hypothetical protein
MPLDDEPSRLLAGMAGVTAITLSLLLAGMISDLTSEASKVEPKVKAQGLSHGPAKMDGRKGGIFDI